MDFTKVIIVRHGNYDKNDRLDSSGAAQMRNLAAKIAEYLDGEKNVILLSSSAPRAEDSVKIISEKLGIPYVAHEHFWSDKQHSQDYDRALALMKAEVGKKGTTIAILVTHLEYANYLPRHVVMNAGKSFRLHGGLEKGDMLFIDLENEVSEITEG